MNKEQNGDHAFNETCKQEFSLQEKKRLYFTHLSCKQKVPVYVRLFTLLLLNNRLFA